MRVPATWLNDVPCGDLGSGSGLPVSSGAAMLATAAALSEVKEPRTTLATSAKVMTARTACRHLGSPTGRMLKCAPCRGNTMLKVMACAVHGKCVLGASADNLVGCQSCPDYVPRNQDDNVAINLPGHFNPGLTEYRGKLLLASRLGWAGSRVALSELDENYQPVWSKILSIHHPDALSGAEDPRLFWFQNKLHVAVTGYEAKIQPRTSQLVCRLDANLDVETVWAPAFADRAAWEKNWQFFVHEDQLYSVYSILPHVILRHDGEGSVKAAKTDHSFRSAGSQYLRGGSPPVLVNGEFYHWFHSVRHSGGEIVYGGGLYTFEAKPPFAVQRAIFRPLLVPDETSRPANWTKSVVFPCGAILKSGKWVISYGQHDRECRVTTFDAAEIERQLVRVP